MSTARELSQFASAITVDANNHIEFNSTYTVAMGGLTMPAADGTSGQMLTTDGSGNLSFVSGATQSDITTAINNLVDSAPGTLDTLNELAAALGDDPNFATTVTNSIAAKMGNVVEDTTPQLGGTLDLNSQNIAGTVSLMSGTDELAQQFLSISPNGYSATIDTNYGLSIGAATGFAVSVNAFPAIDVGNTAAITFNGQYTFPTSDGANGQVLTTDGAGTLSFADASGGMSNLVEDTTPQLGGDLDINAKAFKGKIIYKNASGTEILSLEDVGGPATFRSPTDKDVYFMVSGESGTGQFQVDAPGGIVLGSNAGAVSIRNINYPTSDGTAGQVMTTDGAGTLSFADASGGISNLVEDTTPQLGGDLDMNDKNITGIAVFKDVVYLQDNTQPPSIGLYPVTGDIIAASLNGIVYPSLSGDGTAGQVLTTDGSGTLSFADASGGISSVAEDTTPQLGGDLDINAKAFKGKIIYKNASGTEYLSLEDGVFNSPTNTSINWYVGGESGTGQFTVDAPGGIVLGSNAGAVSIRNINYPIADGTAGQVMTTDGAGNVSFADASGGISNVVEDTAPQLGGDLDMNGKTINMSGSASRIAAFSGDDVVVDSYGVVGNAGNIYLTTYSEGGDRGHVTINYIKYPNSDGTPGQVMTTDGSGNLSFADASGGGGTFADRYVASILFR